MTRDARSIALIGFDEPTSGALAKALRDSGGVKLEEVASPLASINGHAVRLSSEHDLVVFRTGSASEADIAALEEIRRNAKKKATIVALTEGSASLDSAHKLSRAGADFVLPDTMSAEEVREQLLERILASVGHKAGRRRGKIVSVAQSRGGVGSTTVAVNLADALLGRTGTFRKTVQNRVALVDLDLQFGAVAGFLDAPPSDALYHLASEGIVPDATFLEQAMTDLPCGLSVLAAPAHFAPMDALTPEQVRAILETLSAEYDYVVVDLPRALVDWMAPALELSDRMLMVTDSAVPSIQQARRLIDFYTEDNIGLPIDIVVNGEKRPIVRGRHHTEAAKVLERPLDIWLPPDPRAAREAIDRGVPLSEAAARSHLAKALRKLGRRILTDLAQPAQRAVAAD